VAENAPANFYRSDRSGKGMAVWEHKGKAAAIGVGHSDTARRWDWKPDTSVGAWTIQAIRRAIADAGVDPSTIDGLVFDSTTTTGAYWDNRPIPPDHAEMWKSTNDPLDGIAKLSDEWIIKNMPELTNVKFTMIGPGCMSNCVVVAAEAIGRGLTSTCLVVKSWHNFEGRYYQGGGNALDTVAGPGKFGALWAGPASYTTAQQFQRYMWKYNKTHDMMFNFVRQETENGLLFPEGYWSQHRPESLTREDYINARWVAKPANLFDNDIPIMSCACYVFTTADRAKDAKNKPVYIINHGTDQIKTRGIQPVLEEVQECARLNGINLTSGAGMSPNDLSFENMYDGFTLFHVFHLEGLGVQGIHEGEALDYFETQDLGLTSKFPISPSGGNRGSGRTRTWMHTDCIQQISGRAGKRQISVPAHAGVSGGPFPYGGNFTVWADSPNYPN
jgi:hypothetical protein